MKVYTKTGDGGNTGLYGGARIRKDHLRIEAYGTLDELNSIVGLVRSNSVAKKADTILEAIQIELFNMGSHLASDPSADLPLPELKDELISKLESAMDEMTAELPKLRSFVLPGGSLACSHAHLARTVCRRAERRVISLSDTEEVPEKVIVFLNRLSDYFFVLSRYILLQEGRKDVLWHSGV